MTTRTFVLASLLAFTAIPAAAAITVLGDSSARLCYEAAEFGRTSARTGLERCNQALREDGTTHNEIVATYVNRGILKLRMGQVDPAIADFDEAIAQDDDEAEAYLNKGIAMLRDENRRSDAVGLFDAALQKRTRKPALAHYARAVSHELNGRLKDAYLDYRQANRLDPEWEDPKEQLARFTVRQN